MLMTYIAITDKEQVIVDARTKEECDGLKTKTDKLGHITWLLNISGLLLLQTDACR